MWRQLRILLPAIARHRRTYLLGLSCVLLSNLFGVWSPRFLQRGIDGLTHQAPLSVVGMAALAMVATATLGGLARYGMRDWLNGGSRLVEFDLRNRLFRHLSTLSASFYDRAPTGDLMARLTNDLLAVRMVAGPSIMYLIDTAVRSALIFPAMLAISPLLTAIAAVPLLGLPLTMTLLGQKIHYRSLAIQEQFGEISNFVHEHLSGVRIVRAYRQEPAEVRHFIELSDDYRNRNLALARVQGLFHPLLTLFGGLGGVAVLAVGGRFVIDGTVSVGAFVSFGVYLAMLVWPMIALGWALNLLQRGAAAMARIEALFAERTDVPDPAEPAALPPHAHARSVTFEHVWFRYPNAPERGWVLEDVSLHVPAGTTLAVVGATGSGKSTLVDLLVRTYDPDRGRILVDGVDIRTLPAAVLRRAVGFVPQETFLFSETLRENVLLGAPDDGRAERAAEVSQLSAAVPSLPQGWDTLIGERGVNLSGGQKQRSAIARALAQDPPLFVLDDALSAVDAQTETIILGNLRGALADRTVVMVSHRLAAVRDADQIVVLDGGRIVERGTHAELVARDGRYWELLHRQEVEAQLTGEGAA